MALLHECLGAYSSTSFHILSVGTSPASGIALLTASLKEFLAIQCRAMYTTHFLEIFSMNLLGECLSNIRPMQMSIQMPASNDDFPIPLFRLEEGVASSSAGILCAKRAGVKDAVLQRANEILSSMRQRRQVQPLAEILRRNLNYSVTTREALHALITNQWSGCDVDELESFVARVKRM
jgi:DNA mismatch repair protein MSH5